MIFINALVDNYSKDELCRIVKKSHNIAEVVEKLGYKTKNGSNYKTVMKRIAKYNLSVDHFEYVKGIERTYENVFCKNSTANQSTLRRWYSKYSDDSTCSICGQSKIWNEKELTMILDHIDGDNHNDLIENLRWICPNCNSQLPTFTGRNNKIRKTEKSIRYIPVNKMKKTKKICPICNINKIDLKSKMCRDCYRKKQSQNIPPKDDLEKLIYKVSFVEIGKKYGVSDNTIRKWCKKYNLPFKYGDLHKYSA